MAVRPTRIVERLLWIARSGQQAHPKGREWSGVHLERLGVVSTPSRRDEKALLKGMDRSGGPPGGLLVVSSPFYRAGRGWEVLPEVWEWSRGPPGGLLVVGSPFRRVGRGWEVLREGRGWSGGPPGVPGVDGRPYPRAGSGNEAILGSQKWSAGPPRRPGVVRTPS